MRRNFVSRSWRFPLVLGAVALVLAAGLPAVADDSTAQASPVEFARQLDAQLAVELPILDGNSVAGRTDDETFLRRITQDLTGELPTPEEVTAFVLDPASDKREQAVDRLLADPRYGQNWGRYFRDVILFRRTDDRSLLGRQGLTTYLAEQFNSGACWDTISKAFITAEGDMRENGNTGIIMAQMAQAVDIAAETARIFLGIQIQCAQCHDHPTDRWKREQFHQLAAFFPRIAIRPVRDGDKRISFTVVSRDFAPASRDKKPNAKAAEHYMPDLKDPSAKGTQMTPVFFVSGQSLPAGKKDLERRQQLAEWITAEANPWFARAFVNRIWAELLGQGFYEPVDDLGPDRRPSAPQSIELLSQEFARQKYDVKWLMRTIVATNTYQRESRSQREDATTPFAANCPQPLRADQVFNALATALSIDESLFMPPGGPMGIAASVPRAVRVASSNVRSATTRAPARRGCLLDPAGPVDDELAAAIARHQRQEPEYRARQAIGRQGGRRNDRHRVVLAVPGPRAEAGRVGHLPVIHQHLPRSGRSVRRRPVALVNSTEFTHRK